MKSPKLSLRTSALALSAAALALASLSLGSASAQPIAYDDAGNYYVTANWTNGANQGYGFTPWAFTTNGPDSHGTYVTSGNVPPFVIASVTNVLGTNYTAIWGTYANGTNGANDTVAYRGFVNPLGTNTFKLQWGSRGAGVTTVNGVGAVHGWCGFTLRNGNATNSTTDFETGVLLYFYFQDGNSPATLYYWDNNGVQSVPGTSFSDLGRNNITNAIEAEVTPGADGATYLLVLKDCVQNRTIFTTRGTFIGGVSNTVDSAALFCHETTGDQIYNRMQIAAPTNIPPQIVNVVPADASLYLDASVTTLSFEVDSFNSTVSSSAVNVYLNGILQPGASLTFNTADPTNQLLVSCSTPIAPDTFYKYTITAQDAYGNVVSNNYTFNTFLPTDLYIDCGDYNYSSGQFVNSSTPSDAYANLLGNQGIDYFDTDLSGTNNIYRPGDLPQILSLNTDATGDPIPHAGDGFTIYSLGFTDPTEWQNYTRVLPAATNYNIYARASSAAGGQFEIEELANATATVANQPYAALGRVNVPATGGSKVCSGQLTPLTDIFGNTVVVPLSGTKTLRCTAISNRGYNLEYLVVVAVTNATSTLRPYVATATPVPNATGVSLASPITFTLANRQTTVTPATIQVFLNTSNLTSRLVLSNNAAGSTVTYTPTNNLPANATNTLTAIFTDSASVSVTNSWTFITTSVGGVPGNGLWAGAGFDQNWSTAANWTGGTPGPGFSATFATPGSTTTFVTNNVVATNTTILQLNYTTNANGYHTTLIPDGVTLTVTNGSTSVTAAVQVGADNTFNKPVTNTITGPNGTLLVLGNPQSSGLANQLNFQIRQCASPAAPNQTTLDMSGLGTLVATVGKFYVAQGGAAVGQSNVSGCVYLARTNTITVLRPNAGQFEVGDSSGGAYTLPGSVLNLGITNALFVDTMRIGKQKATNNLVRFNPAFAANNPSVFIRGTNGLASRLTTWTIGDADTEATVPNFVQANVDFSGGKLDALVGTLIIGRGETSASDTGYAQGTLTFTAGTLDASTVQLGVQRAVNNASEIATLNISGPATLASTNIVLAQTNAGASASFVSGTLNVTNGTVRGNLIAGGGISTVNLSAATLIVSNTAGTPALPLTTLNLASASLHLKVDGNNATTPIVNATAVGVSGTSTITIDSVANVAVPGTIQLLKYAGADPFAGVTMPAPPAGYNGNLVDNTANHSIDLNLTVLTPPTVGNILLLSGGQVVISGTNNAGAGGSYHVLTSTNVASPMANWSVLPSGSFDANGNFASTNSAGTNAHRFFRVRVP